MSQGSIVTVEFSSGIPPELIDLRGYGLEDVEAAITAFNDSTGLNLVWTIENVPTDEPSVLGRVIGTNPPAGSLVEPEQLIVIFIGVPDLGD